MIRLNRKTKELFNEAYDELVNHCIIICHQKYNFDKKVAKKFINQIDNKNKTFLLPFVGKIYDDRCKAIKYASGLHIQCYNQHQKNDDYCQKHSKEAEISLNKKPIVGDIRDRLGCSLLDYTDFKKRRTKAYITVIKEKKMNKEECLYEAKMAGIVIPEIHWKKKIRRRGRPKKKTIIAVSDTDSDSDNSIIERIHDIVQKSENKKEQNILFEDDEKLIDEKLGFIFSKKTGKLIGFL